MLDGRPIPVFGDGSTRRDYSFIADVVAGIRAAMSYTASGYDVVNLGNNHTITLREMIAGLERALGVKAVIDWQPDQPGDVPQTWADLTLARELFGYSPSMAYADGVRAFAEWLTARPEAALPGR